MTGGESLFQDEQVRSQLNRALPGYLPNQRWFGDKARNIQAVDVVATFDIHGVDVPAAFAVIKVSFGDGGTARYGLPIAAGETGADSDGAIVTVDWASGTAIVRDALLDPGFRDWVLRLLIDGTPVLAGAGRLVIERVSGLEDRLNGLRSAPSRVLGVEQSNSSLVYGDDVFVKLFRRLQPGINPDVELTRFLTVKAGFENTPAFVGSISYEAPSGESTVVAIAQEYQDSAGDGWSFVLDMLQRHVSDGSRAGRESETVARRLGEVTAKMHLALAGEPWDPELSSESIRNADTDRWRSGYLSMLDSVVAGISHAKPTMDARTTELASALLELAPGLRNRAEGFDRLYGRAKTRVHGDYHLGQLLRTADADFAVIDFEGEPQRSIEERRMKTSPLKDVAGMLRSFAYARGTVTARLEASEAATSAAAELVAWERRMRSNFLEAYLATASEGGAPFLPASPSDTQAAIAAWELDKAVYEVQYELNNRPDWLWIPLSGMLKYGTPET